jgi:hypothetical protein
LQHYDMTGSDSCDQHSRLSNDEDQVQHGYDVLRNNDNDSPMFFSPINTLMEDQISGDWSLPTDYNLSAEASSGAEASSSEAQMRSKEIKKRSLQRPVNSNQSTKKRKSATVSFESSHAVRLNDYLVLEEKRCRSLGLPFSPTETESAIRASNMSLKESEFITLKIFYFAIGSPESFVALQEILRVQRTTCGNKEAKTDSDLSPADRIRLIEGIGPNIAYLVLRRRCHVYQLFLDCSTGSRKRSDGFIIATAQSISRQEIPRIGNPNNIEDARITDDILKELYPGLKVNADQYKKKRRFVQNLRRLGERLDLLVKEFGYGILGLLSWPDGDPFEVPSLVFTDDL